MNTFRLISILSILLLIAPVTQAQLLKKLKQAAQDGVEDAVERRVAHEIQKAAQKQTDRYMEQVFGPPTQYEGSGYDYGKMLESINMNVETDDEYQFTGYTDMEISGTDEKGKAIDPTMFRTFLNPDKEAWAMQLETDDKDLENTIMIFDNKNQATILLMEDKKGEKSRIAYGMDWSKMMDEAVTDSAMQDIADFNITKTGNTKTVLGYACDEYMTETEEYTAKYWVSQEPVTGYASYWSKNNFMFSRQMKNKYSAYFDKLPEGDVLEMEYISKTDEGVTKMQIKEIDTSTKFDFVMADYTNAMEAQPEEN